jgi:N-acetyl-anhydromuramyl-L-alanine amidase AmpD
MHHTGGGGTVQGVVDTLRQRGLGVQYVMDRDGRIFQVGGAGEHHIMSGWGRGAGLSNANVVGMEVIAKNDRDVTERQIEAAKKFIARNYPKTPVFGHGEVNPGHKEATGGMSIVNAIRSMRAHGETIAAWVSRRAVSRRHCAAARQ